MSEEFDQLDLPESLVDGLRDAYTHRVNIPGSRDQAILSAAGAKFAQRRRLRLIARWGTGLAAGIAAMIVVAISLHHPAATHLVVKGDINADGQLNIVDALALARHLADRDRLDKSWDINADGVIDQRDVDALAQAAVSLKQGGLVNHSLPKLHDLGIDRLNVGFASANGIPGVPHEKAFAKANPTIDTKHRNEESR